MLDITLQQAPVGYPADLQAIVNNIIGNWHNSMMHTLSINNNPDDSYDKLESEIEKVEHDMCAKLCDVIKQIYPNPDTPLTALITSSLEELTSATADVLVFTGDLAKQELDGMNFDGIIFVGANLKNTKFNNCRFRNTKFLLCDMRYVEVNGGTMESSLIWWCDLYRAYFQGVVRFVGAKIEASSLHNAYFASGVLLRRENLARRRLLQEDEDVYRRFMIIVNTLRENANKQDKRDRTSREKKLTATLRHRYDEVELIYKNLSSAFSSNGFNYDSNWAYVKGKRAERAATWRKLGDMRLTDAASFLRYLRYLGKNLINLTYDLLFGYGESLVKIFVSYMVIVVVFTFIYLYKADLDSVWHSFTISLSNMIGSKSEELESQNDIFLNMLNLVQTTMGILLTGIFGFILGNKIRNQ